MEEKKKEVKKIYRLTVWSHYEEDSDEPYTVDFDSRPDALNAKEGYESELTLSGQQAYSVVGPDVVTLSYLQQIKDVICVKKGDESSNV